MRNHFPLTAVTLLLLGAAPLGAQATNPAHLAEMPPVERVLRETTGSTPDETAARRMGSFLQLKKIIEEMSEGRWARNRLTPDETRLIQAYYAAYQNIAVTKPEYQKFTGLKGYDIDPRFRDELFDRFFSAAFRARYGQLNAEFERRRQARAREDTANMMRIRAEVAEYQQRQQGGSADTRAMVRCVASGRSESECLSEGLVKGFKDLFGAVLPGGKKLPTGLRLSGVFGGAGNARLTFWDAHAVAGCGQLVADERAYAVDIRDNRLVVSLATLPQLFEVLEGASPRVLLTVGADGRLAGPAAAELTGRVIVGYQEIIRTYSDGRVVPMTQPIYERRTVRCNLAALALSGPSPAIGKVSEGIAVGLDVLLGGGEAKPLRPAPTGLRLSGEWGEQSGFDLEFHPHAVVVGCGDAVIAREYAVSVQAGQVAVRIQHGAVPFGVTVRPDGALAGSGSVAVAGRVIAGMDANNDPVWAPRSGTCPVGILPPAGTAAVASGGPRTGAPAAPNPAVSGSVAAPVPAGTATAVLSVTTGFAAPAGGGNPLGKTGLYLLRTSYEEVLAGVGLRGGGGSTGIMAMVSACERQQPECAKAVVAMAQNATAVLMTDSNGNGDFAAVPAGSYYIVGLTAVGNQPVVWNLRVELKPGSNAVSLSEKNGARTR